MATFISRAVSRSLTTSLLARTARGEGAQRSALAGKSSLRVPFIRKKLLGSARRTCSSASSSTTEYDVVVLGGGVIGAATADSIASRGVSCLLVEQFEPGHERGSSHGDGRIFRFAYEEQIYVQLMKHALEGWQQLENDTGAGHCESDTAALTEPTIRAQRAIPYLYTLFRTPGVPEGAAGDAFDT
ncbi:hypothetical protein CYMTET_8091 [Cymbomonas tetramitiformis]|uniref:FAD dependent oxidoreductase domain-containing protein n=1 Tax=Cymbomonas tetramitiformis TaxID=36881 RepID=A0AAE0LGU3_9CHLO|nr:hypothetical protein CYMTET_8091 [Cymbomonas tetramitiformis]